MAAQKPAKLNTSTGKVSGFGTGDYLAVLYGGTGLATIALGSLIYASALDTFSELVVGTEGYVLTVVSGVPAWSASSGGANSKVDWMSFRGLKNRSSGAGGSSSTDTGPEFLAWIAL